MTSNYVCITFIWETAIISNIYCSQHHRPLKGGVFYILPRPHPPEMSVPRARTTVTKAGGT
jgi:hypothetical protein